MSRYQLYLVGKGSWTDFLGCFDTWLSASCADVDKNVFYALIPMSNLLWWDTGLPADLKTQQEDVSNSHCEDGNIFKIHTPLSILVACLKGSNSGLAKDVFGSERTTSTVAILGLPRGTAGGGGATTKGFVLSGTRTGSMLSWKTLWWEENFTTFWTLIIKWGYVRRNWLSRFYIFVHNCTLL